MAEPPPSTAANEFASKEKTSESLSQFIARVLGQLSLSAWLPSGVLVLGVATIVAFGWAMTVEPPPDNALVAFTQAIRRIAGLGLGGAIALILTITFATVITQAFSLEAIRFLEGYWGTWPPVEMVAGWRRKRFASKRSRLDNRFRDVTKRAWESARSELEAEQSRLGSSKETKKDAIYTPNVIAVVGARATGTESPEVKLTKAEKITSEELQWHIWAQPELLRRRVSIDKKRRDFPQPKRAMPTRLGGVLRVYEDATQRENLETFIQRNFDRMPPSLRQEHDDQRTRLDVYGTMVFVCATLGLAAALRAAPFGWWYVSGATLLGLIGIFACYRAAIATARAYGAILVIASDTVRKLDTDDKRVAGTSTSTNA